MAERHGHSHGRSPYFASQISSSRNQESEEFERSRILARNERREVEDNMAGRERLVERWREVKKLAGSCGVMIDAHVAFGLARLSNFRQ